MNLAYTFGPVNRDGIRAYTHLIRSPDDGDRVDRGQSGGHTPISWKADLSDDSFLVWKRAIVELLSDDKPRTFNRIVLEISGGKYTADVAFEKAPDQALWHLVELRRVIHSIDAPILFRRPRRGDA